MSTKCWPIRGDPHDRHIRQITRAESGLARAANAPVVKRATPCCVSDKQSVERPGLRASGELVGSGGPLLALSPSHPSKSANAEPSVYEKLLVWSERTSVTAGAESPRQAARRPGKNAKLLTYIGERGSFWNSGRNEASECVCRLSR